MFDAHKGTYRDEVARVNSEIQELRQQIGRRRATAVATFAHNLGLEVEWPSQFNGGRTGVPVLGLAAAGYAGITASAAEQPRPEDSAERELAELRDRLLTLQTLGEQPAAMALDQLVARAQRKGQ